MKDATLKQFISNPETKIIIRPAVMSIRIDIIL